jgi:hypothetical protein
MKINVLSPEVTDLTRKTTAAIPAPIVCDCFANLPATSSV